MPFDVGKFTDYANSPGANFTESYLEVVNLLENNNRNPEELIRASNQQIDMVEQLIASGEERVLTPQQTGLAEDLVINQITGPDLIKDAHIAFMAVRTYQYMSGNYDETELVMLFLDKVDFSVEEERQRIEDIVNANEREEEERQRQEEERQRQEEERQRQEEERQRQEEEERLIERDIIAIDRLDINKNFYSRGW